MIKTYDIMINKILFNVNFESKNAEGKVLKNINLVDDLVNQFGEQYVFNEWYKYLLDIVNDKKSAKNFMIAFYNYGGHDFKVENPYPFLSTLFIKLGLSIDSEPTDSELELFDTFDSIYVSLLINASLANKDEYFNLNIFSDKEFVDMVKQNKNDNL